MFPKYLYAGIVAFVFSMTVISLIIGVFGEALSELEDKEQSAIGFAFVFIPVIGVLIGIESYGIVFKKHFMEMETDE